MDDNIELPPPPLAIEPMHTKAAMQSYARAAVLADRKRRSEQAKPVVHWATLSLGQNGSWSCYPPSIHRECAVVTIHWTADGRAWIESERNRALATELRRLYASCMSIHCHSAADALDGGVR
jgi:hypothetical protein